MNETIFKDVSDMGFAGLELFDWQINGLESQSLLGPFVDKYKLPLIASYTNVNLTDPSQRAATIAAAVNVGTIMKKYGGKTIVVGPSGRVGGASYNFNEHKQNIVTTLNELGKAITDIGLIAALHQHTGTAVETRDETYATMEAVDTRYVKFGPDIGQLQKGGVDPVAVVKHFLPVVQHLHFKDFVGGTSMAGYCALGLGKVDLVGIVRRSQIKRQFAPDNDPAKNFWFHVDAPLMRKMAGGAPDPALDSFFLEADGTANPGGLPVGGQTRLDIPNDHLQYAITWFLIALAAAGVYLAYHWENGRLTVNGRTKVKTA